MADLVLQELPISNSWWRSAQLTCLHIVKPNAPLYPEHFLNNAQLEKGWQETQIYAGSTKRH
jgi:hypothetical protein